MLQWGGKLTGPDGTGAYLIGGFPLIFTGGYRAPNGAGRGAIAFTFGIFTGLFETEIYSTGGVDNISASLLKN